MTASIIDEITQGSPLFMATQILADPFSQRVLHTIKHDLEGFWWSTLFVVLNCEGPYGRIVDWREERLKNNREPEIEIEDPDEPYGIDIPPPNWLRSGVQNISYKTIVGGRLQSLGNWSFFEQLVLDFWHDPAILYGLKEMFEIFMPLNLTTPLDQERKRKRAEGTSPGRRGRIIINDAAIDVTHEKMIDIVKRILDNMADEPAPSRAEVEEARKQYGEKLRCDLFSSPEDDDSRPPSRPPSASSESQPPKRRGSEKKPIQDANPANNPAGPSYHIFHSQGSANSLHITHTDMNSMPTVAAANRIFASTTTSPVIGQKRQRSSIPPWSTGTVPSSSYNLGSIAELDEEGDDEGDYVDDADDNNDRGKRQRGSG